MSDTLPTYEQLVASSLRALEIAQEILSTVGDDMTPSDAHLIIATAQLTVAGAQVFATLAGAVGSHLEPFVPNVTFGDNVIPLNRD